MSGSLVVFNQESSLGFILGEISVNGATSLLSLHSLAAFIPLRMNCLLDPHPENCQGPRRSMMNVRFIFLHEIIT